MNKNIYYTFCKPQDISNRFNHQYYLIFCYIKFNIRVYCFTNNIQKYEISYTNTYEI